MADGARIRIDKDKLIRKFRRLVPASKEELTAAAVQGAGEVAELAKRFTRSRRVRASIHVEPVPEKLAAQVVAGGPGTMVEARRGTGQMISLARLEEFGTRPHKNKGLYAGTRHPGTRPHPFLFPAARLLRKKNKAKMSRALGKAARKVAGTS